MSALLWHAEAAEHLAKAFKGQADIAEKEGDNETCNLLYHFAIAHQEAAKSMREQLRAEAQGGTDGR